MAENKFYDYATGKGSGTLYVVGSSVKTFEGAISSIMDDAGFDFENFDTEVNKWIGRNRQYTILSINTFYRGDKVFNHCATIVYEVNVPDAKKH